MAVGMRGMGGKGLIFPQPQIGPWPATRQEPIKTRIKPKLAACSGGLRASQGYVSAPNRI